LVIAAAGTANSRKPREIGASECTICTKI